MKKIIFGAFACLMVSTNFSPAQTHSMMLPVEQAVNDYIQPNFERFASEADLLSSAMAELCDHPSSQELETTRTAFKNTINSFSRIELVRLGPLLEKNYLERFLFWPDRQGIALKQVQKILHKKDQSVLSIDSLEKKERCFTRVWYVRIYFIWHGITSFGN